MSHKNKHIFFLDTEFEEEIGLNGETIVTLISVGLVGISKERKMSAASYYGVSNAFNESALKREWLVKNVLSKLPAQEARQSLEEIRQGILNCFSKADEIEIWADHPYDFIILRQLFGGHNEMYDAINEKTGGSLKFRNLNELSRVVPFVEREKQTAGKRHIAIEDAKAGRINYINMSEALPNHLKAHLL